MTNFRIYIIPENNCNNFGTYMTTHIEVFFFNFFGHECTGLLIYLVVQNLKNPQIHGLR